VGCCRARSLGNHAHGLLLWVPASAPSSSSLFSCQRSPAGRIGRTSGVGAFADSASAPFTHSRSPSRSRIAKPCCVLSPDEVARKRLRAAWFPLAARFSAGRRSRQTKRGSSKDLLPAVSNRPAAIANTWAPQPYDGRHHVGIVPPLSGASEGRLCSVGAFTTCFDF